MGSVDHYTPSEIASLVETKGVTKATAPAVTLFVLGVLAGAFIGLGAVLATTISTGSARSATGRRDGSPGLASRWD